MKTKTKIIMVLVLILALTVGFTGEKIIRLGKSEANITFEQLGESNIYDMHINTTTCEQPLLSIIDNVGQIEFESFGEQIGGYSNVTDTLYFRKHVNFVDGITQDVELGDGTVLVIEDGLIVGIK